MSKTVIPATIRRDLWVACGGRCEFRGCNTSLDRNFITQERVKLGEYCHIIADSPEGPRGDAKDSPLLSIEPSNIIMCCTGCHKTIDDGRLSGQYTPQLLRQMKEEHERHIDAIYRARVEKRSVPLILTAPISGTPISISADVARAAVLMKTDYRRFPSHDVERIDIDFYPGENDPEFYRLNAVRIRDVIGNFLRRVSRDRLEYLDVFALAHIPFLFLIGTLIGDRIPCSVHQPQRDQANPWVWPDQTAQERPVFQFAIPETGGFNEIAVAISISGNVLESEIKASLPNAIVLPFHVTNPSPRVVDSEDVLIDFRKHWLERVTRIHENFPGVTVHLFPAVPNSIAVEMGRAIHPHASPRFTIWNKVNGSFLKALDCP